MMIEAWRVPAADGWNVTANWQVSLEDTEAHVLVVIANSAGTELVSFEMDTVRAPTFRSVTTALALVAPTTVSAKERLPGITS